MRRKNQITGVSSMIRSVLRRSRASSCLLIFFAFCIISLFMLADKKLDWEKFSERISIASMPSSKKRETKFNSLRLQAVDKKTKKWIVLMSERHPTENVKRLASLPEWTVIVVGDGKTPSDWKLDDVHFLSIDDQERLKLDSVNALPLGSDSRKNAGYLYAIANGANWIYDTDDNNKPFGKGLDQFDYDGTVSGVRFEDADSEESLLQKRLFNPYKHFGAVKMWPRGFPLEYLSQHEHAVGMFRVCKRMRRAAVQQGMFHKEPDVDAIYRLLKGDPKTTRVNARFNKFAPPVTLAPDTYSPLNSQNTLFHRRAFFGLFLPTTVSKRVTDIWRSFFTQKLLHLIGESVSFVPPNSMQTRLAQHNVLDELKQEKDIYEKTCDLLSFLDSWECPHPSVDACAIQMAADMAAKQFWGKEDARLVRLWIEDLKEIGYKFPPLGDGRSDYPINMSNSTRLHNCRPMHIQLTTELQIPDDLSQQITKRAAEKIASFGELQRWCRAAPKCGKLTFNFPAPETLAAQHATLPAFQQKLDTVLILTNNYPWRFGIGLLQRLYAAFFGAVFICGTYDANELDKKADSKYPSTKSPVNYVYLSEDEMFRGFHAYLCLAKVKELRLQNVKGYFMVADDAIFNLWHPLDLSIAHHADRKFHPGYWWTQPVGWKAAKRVVALIEQKYAKDPEIQRAWRQYNDALSTYNYVAPGDHRVRNASQQFVIPDGWAISDWHYLPSSNLSYVAALANVFYEARLFGEIVFHKLLYTLPHELHNVLYLWLADRVKWPQSYSPSLLALHPVKMSRFANASTVSRSLFCRKILATMHANIFRPPK